MPAILFWSLVALAGTAIIWVGSGALEQASERLGRHYGLPEVVKGAILVAVGSSFPELTTTVLAALLHGEFELGVAAIVGSALFNITVIPAVSGLAGRTPLRTDRDLVYKEAQFYMVAVATLTLTFAFAVIYHPVGGDTGSLRGELTRWLVLGPVALYGIYVFAQYQDTLDHEEAEQTTEVRAGREWLRLAGSMVLIVVGVESLVRAAIHFGEIFGTPSFLWGVTVVAAGTSLPDAFVSIRAARARAGLTSIANVLGSNTFDLLICIPAGILIAGSAVIDFSVAAPMMAVLTAATVLLFLMLRTRMRIDRTESVLLLAFYVGFVVWISLETFGVVDLIPSLPPTTPP